MMLSPQHPAMQGDNVINTKAAFCECADFERRRHAAASVISLRGRVVTTCLGAAKQGKHLGVLEFNLETAASKQPP